MYVRTNLYNFHYYALRNFNILVYIKKYETKIISISEEEETVVKSGPHIHNMSLNLDLFYCATDAVGVKNHVDILMIYVR